MADRDLQFLGLLARFLRKQTHKTHRNAVRRLRRQGDRLAGDTCDGDAANVAAVCKFLEIIVRQWHWDSSLLYQDASVSMGEADRSYPSGSHAQHGKRGVGRVLLSHSAPKNSSSRAMHRA